jgi:hypothetical protein
MSVMFWVEDVFLSLRTDRWISLITLTARWRSCSSLTHMRRCIS